MKINLIPISKQTTMTSKLLPQTQPLIAGTNLGYQDIYANDAGIYSSIKNDKNFQELANSKFFKGEDLVYKMTLLKKDRDTKIATKYDPNNIPSLPYGIVDYFYVRPKVDYKKYDIPDYLRLLNDFVKSDKISDDLKEYYLQDKSNNLEIYYTKLDRIPTAKTKEEAVAILMAVN